MGATATIASMGMSIMSSQQEASALQMQSAFQNDQAKRNLQIMELQREEILAQGEEDASNTKKQIKQIIGSQKAALAAQGIDVNSEIAKQLERETLDTGFEDVAAIKNNAWKKAWGIEVEESNIRNNIAFNKMATKNQTDNILLTGGLKAVNSGFNGYQRGDFG